jgi:Putative adhesin
MACSSAKPYSTTVGLLLSGSKMRVRVADANVNAYAPLQGDPANRFTISATAAGKASPPPAPSIHPAQHGVTVWAPDPLGELLIRVPNGVGFTVNSAKGDVRVTNVTGPVQVNAARGDVQIVVPGYAQATAGTGTISVTMGSTDWPGTLYFTTGTGDIEVWINETAKFTAHLHTDQGTLFTDFGLTGTSKGASETIDAPVNGGDPSRRIDIETTGGTIRLLKLHPEA